MLSRFLSAAEAKKVIALMKRSEYIPLVTRVGIDAAVSPRGYRLLAKVPRLPGAVIDRLVDHFGSLQKLLAAGDRKFLINLAEIDYIDSSGLGEFVTAFTTVRNMGGQLKLLNLTKRITDLLSITKLLTVFETYDSETDAVRSFSSSPV